MCREIRRAMTRVVHCCRWLPIAALQSTIAEATKTGYLKLALEARLRLGEMEMRSSARTPARARLAGVEAEARRKGFVRLAGKAQAAQDGGRRAMTMKNPPSR